MELKLDRIEEPFVFELKNESGSTCILDASPAIGGLGKGFRPMELLAGSLAGCVVIEVIHILKKQRIEPKHIRTRIIGERKESIPSSFEKIELIFEIDKEIDETNLRKIIQMTIDKYCSVSASLDKSIIIDYSISYQ